MGMWCGGRWPTFSGGNGGGLARWDHPHTNIHKTPSPVRGLVTLCLPRRSWVQPGWLQTFCMSLSMHVCVWVCVFVCDTNGVPAWATICHPPSQREALGRWGGGGPSATEATSWLILSVTRRSGAMFKVPRLFIWARDGGRWSDGWGDHSYCDRCFVKNDNTHSHTHVHCPNWMDRWMIERMETRMTSLWVSVCVCLRKSHIYYYYPLFIQVKEI